MAVTKRNINSFLGFEAVPRPEGPEPCDQVGIAVDSPEEGRDWEDAVECVACCRWRYD